MRAVVSLASLLGSKSLQPSTSTGTNTIVRAEGGQSYSFLFSLIKPFAAETTLLTGRSRTTVGATSGAICQVGATCPIPRNPRRSVKPLASGLAQV